MKPLIARNPDVAWREEPEERERIARALERGEDASDRGWVLLVDRGRMHQLNLVAGEIWLLADGTRDAGGVARELADRFDAPYEDILADVEAFLSECRSNGWIREAPG